jgi:hypothetical protein
MVEQLAIVITLRAGAEEHARKLIEDGPPFDPRDRGFSRHTVYLSANEIVFAFEGDEVGWLVDELVDDPSVWGVHEAFRQWRPLVDGPPRIAHAVYAWAREPARPPPPPQH